MRQVIVEGLRKYNDVINISQTIGTSSRTKNLIYDALKSWRAVLDTLRENGELVMIITCRKCGFWTIFRCKWYLEITILEIKLCEVNGLRKLIENIVDSR